MLFKRLTTLFRAEAASTTPDPFAAVPHALHLENNERFLGSDTNLQ